MSSMVPDHIDDPLTVCDYRETMIEARLAMMQSVLAMLMAEELRRWPDPAGKLRAMKEERRKMLAELEEGEDAVTLWREYVLFFGEVERLL